MSEKTFVPLAIAMATVSDTRTLETDTSGALCEERLRAAGHHFLERRIVKDDVSEIRAALAHFIDAARADAVILTGGTGLTARDVTPEALESLTTKAIPGF